MKNKLNHLLSSRAKRLEWSPVELVSRIIREKKNLINLASGSPDPDLIPIDEIKEALDEAINEYGADVFSYPGAGGLKELRKELKQFLASMGLNINNREIIITAGAQHAINMLANIILNEQDYFISENPTFVETFNALKHYTANYVAVDIDENGILIGELQQLIEKRKEEIKVLYTIPTAHNPTGVTLTPERRKELIELCDKYDIIIIEDDPYRFIIRNPPEPLINIDKQEIVVHVGSFSKILAPGLRIGYLIVPRYISEKNEQAEQLDFATSTITMYIALIMLRKNIVKKRLSKLIITYSRKMKVLLDALEDYMPPNVEWTKPIGGFFLLLRARNKNLAKLLRKAVQNGVAYVPACLFYVKNPDYSTARLSIGPVKEEEINEGIRRLAKILKT